MRKGESNSLSMKEIGEIILDVLDKELACYSSEILFKILERNIKISKTRKTNALEKVSNELKSLKPSTLAREGILSRKFEEYNHRFYYKKDRDKEKVKECIAKKMRAFDKHFDSDNRDRIGNFLEEQVIEILTNKSTTILVNELDNLDGVYLKKERNKEQHIDVFTIYNEKRLGFEVKNKFPAFTEWSEIEDHAKNCNLLETKPVILARRTDKKTLDIFEDQNVEFFPLEKLYYPPDKKEIGEELKEAFKVDFVDIVTNPPSDHLISKIDHVLEE